MDLFFYSKAGFDSGCGAQACVSICLILISELLERILLGLVNIVIRGMCGFMRRYLEAWTLAMSYTEVTTQPKPKLSHSGETLARVR